MALWLGFDGFSKFEVVFEAGKFYGAAGLEWQPNAAGVKTCDMHLFFGEV